MELNIQENASLKPYTVFKIGGPARFFIEVKSKEELIAALTFSKEKNAPFFVAGAGSNILVSDSGFAGLYVRNCANKISVEGEKMFCESGAMMPLLAAEAARHGLSGFEWGIGIPGTIGGSIRGNAGCFGSETKDAVEEADVFDTEKGEIKTFSNKECEFSYRSSLFKKHPELVVLSAVLFLRKANAESVRSRMKELSEKRSDTQDIGAKCAGCIFKNVPWDRKDINKEALLARFPAFKKFENAPGIPAGFLIDEAGLKGKRIGGVVISGKHANFFVNTGEARAEEVAMLIALAKEYVHRKFGILLEEEIGYVGF